MSFASVLAVINGEADSDSVFKTAIGVAQKFDAYVEFLFVAPNCDMPPLVAEPMTAHVLADLMEDARYEANKQRTRFDSLFDHYANVLKAEIKDTGFSFSKREISGNDNREIGHLGRLFDLIVMAKPTPEAGGVDSAALEAALLDTGRPVLVPPTGVDGVDAKRITIAWDGSREAALSVSQAMPFLRRAQSVEIIYITSGKHTETSPNDAVTYLRRHGVAAQQRTIPQVDESISDTLLQSARADGADLLVMGAYGGNAMLEYVFGGVTREMLQTGNMPLLLAH